MAVNKKITLPEFLYFGTKDGIGKTLPSNGIEPPMILTDVYAPHFAFYESGENIKWSIIQIATANLYKESFKPFHGYIERFTRKRASAKDRTPEGIGKRRQEYLDKIDLSRVKWHDSFNACGTILYANFIRPRDIERVITFDPTHRDANNEVISMVKDAIGPWETTPDHHRKEWPKNSDLMDWFMCKELDFTKTWALNRNGLDMYYKAPESERERSKL